MKANNIDAPAYKVEPQDDDAIIARALAILERRVSDRQLVDSPQVAKDFLVLRNASHADQARERFSVMFLDCQHRAIATETLFEGTLTQTSVYPREIVRAALRHEAAAVILSHNHPSGSPQPSRADENLTRTIKDALKLIDVRVLDHMIVTPDGKTCSMAELGLV